MKAMTCALVLIAVSIPPDLGSRYVEANRVVNSLIAWVAAYGICYFLYWGE